jgi:hypothetical protein
VDRGSVQRVRRSAGQDKAVTTVSSICVNANDNFVIGAVF